MIYRIAVTGLNATDDPNPGVAVIRSLRADPEWQNSLHIVGLAYDAMDTGIYSEGLLDEVYMLPYAYQGEGAFLHRMREIRQKTKIDVLIPTLDGELLNIMRSESLLNNMGIHVLLPAESSLKMHYKNVLADFCGANGIPAPRTQVIYDHKQLEAAGRALGYPFVVKGILHEAHTAHSLQQAQAYFDHVKNRWGIPLIAQQYISGEGRGVAALCDRRSKVIGAVAMRKLVVTEAGKGWAGVTVADKEIMALSMKILEGLKWVGPLELEFVREEKTGKLYLLEINPRFPAWIYLTARAGQNLAKSAVELALGKAVKPFTTYKEGVVFIRHAIDEICDLERLAQIVDKGELVFKHNRKGTSEWSKNETTKSSTKNQQLLSTP